jgi:hypothetical protein
MRLKLHYTPIPRSRADRPPRQIPIVRVEVSVRDQDGFERWEELPFLLDTGSDHCLMRHDWAEHTGVIIQNLGDRFATVHTSAGDVRARVGTIRVRMGGQTLTWKCGFTTPAEGEDEQVDEEAHSQWIAMEVSRLFQTRRLLLGRSELLERFTVILDKDYIVITDRRWFCQFVLNPLLRVWDGLLALLPRGRHPE